jgi:hypothetical protein
VIWLLWRTTDTKYTEQALLATRIARTFPNRLHHNFTKSRTKITLAVYCSIRVRVTVAHYLRYILMPVSGTTFLQKVSMTTSKVWQAIQTSKRGIWSVYRMSLSWTQNGWHSRHGECATSTD